MLQLKLVRSLEVKQDFFPSRNSLLHIHFHTFTPGSHRAAPPGTSATKIFSLAHVQGIRVTLRQKPDICFSHCQQRTNWIPVAFEVLMCRQIERDHCCNIANHFTQLRKPACFLYWITSCTCRLDLFINANMHFSICRLTRSSHGKNCCKPLDIKDANLQQGCFANG